MWPDQFPLWWSCFQHTVMCITEAKDINDQLEAWFFLVSKLGEWVIAAAITSRACLSMPVNNWLLNNSVLCLWKFTTLQQEARCQRYMSLMMDERSGRITNAVWGQALWHVSPKSSLCSTRYPLCKDKHTVGLDYSIWSHRAKIEQVWLWSITPDCRQPSTVPRNHRQELSLVLFLYMCLSATRPLLWPHPLFTAASGPVIFLCSPIFRAKPILFPPCPSSLPLTALDRVPVLAYCPLHPAIPTPHLHLLFNATTEFLPPPGRPWAHPAICNSQDLPVSPSSSAHHHYYEFPGSATNDHGFPPLPTASKPFLSCLCFCCLPSLFSSSMLRPFPPPRFPLPLLVVSDSDLTAQFPTMACLFPCAFSWPVALVWLFWWLWNC